MENASAAVQAIKSKAASYRKENVKNQFKVHQLTSNDNKHTPKKKKAMYFPQKRIRVLMQNCNYL